VGVGGGGGEQEVGTELHMWSEQFIPQQAGPHSNICDKIRKYGRYAFEMCLRIPSAPPLFFLRFEYWPKSVVEFSHNIKGTVIEATEVFGMAVVRQN